MQASEQKLKSYSLLRAILVLYWSLVQTLLNRKKNENDSVKCEITGRCCCLVNYKSFLRARAS